MKILFFPKTKQSFYFLSKVTILSWLIVLLGIQQASKAADVYGQIWLSSDSSNWTSGYPRTEVELRDLERNVVIQKTISDERGRYYMFNIPPGRYDVLVDGQSRKTFDVSPNSERRLEIDDITIGF